MDAARRPSPRRTRGAGARRRGRARRHALCDAGAVLACRQVAALRRRHHRRGRRAGGVGDRGSQPGSGRAGARPASRRRHHRRYRTGRDGSRARSRRTFPAHPRQASACDPQACGIVGRQDRCVGPQAGGDFGRSRAGAGASVARAMRRHPGRDRHRAGGRSAADLSFARHGGPFAGARGAGSEPAHSRRQPAGAFGARDAAMGDDLRACRKRRRP